MNVTDPHAPLLEEAAFDHNLNIRVLRLASSMTTIFQRSTLREKGVSTQEYRILVSLARHGAGHVRDVSRKAAMDAAHASRTMKSMSDKGWLCRSPHATDKRLAIFALTPEGRRVFSSVFPEADALAKDFADVFSPQEALQFREFLDRAAAHAALLLQEKES